MKVKTADLTGAALDWAVGIAYGHSVFVAKLGLDSVVWSEIFEGLPYVFAPSTDWSIGGEIFEEFGFSLRFDHEAEVWKSTAMGNTPDNSEPEYKAAHDHESALRAFCRAFVMATIGDTVEIPDELLETAP